MINDFFEILNKEVRYCHFKSNEHLAESFDGKTDFDILIYREDIYKFQKLMCNFGFKRRLSSANKQYFGMEDYIGFDFETGKLFHLHIHYQLIVGKKLKKNYVLGLESILWNNLKLDNQYNLYIPIPEIELVILILRICLKLELTLKNTVKIFLHKKLLPKNIWNEFKYLKDQVDEEELKRLLGELDFNRAMFQNVYELLSVGKIREFKFFKYKSFLIKSFSHFKILSNKKSLSLMKVRKKARLNSGSWLSTIGTSIAFIGCDGAGKSSIVKDIDKWLSWKLSVKNIYMGKPKKTVLSVKIWGKLSNILKKVGLLRIGNYFFEKIYITNAGKRRDNYRISQSLIKSGNIIIFDRYPLKEFWDMTEPMDGPRILKKNQNQKKELELYSAIESPDFLFILNVEVAESLKRKRNQGINENRTQIEKKYNAIQNLIYKKQNESNVFIINTMQDYDNVLLDIKRKIWALV